MPFGAGTVENDPCTVGTTRNYTAGTGNRQNTSARAIYCAHLRRSFKNIFFVNENFSSQGDETVLVLLKQITATRAPKSFQCC